MRRAFAASVVLAALLIAAAQPSFAHDPPAHRSGPRRPAPLLSPAGEVVVATEAPPGRFELVGHDPLFGRGMNAAPAYYNGYLYIGSRTDGAPQHPHAGVLVVDARDASKPAVTGEIGQPNEANIGETSRELRVWPQQKLLLVLNFGCSAILHACVSGSEAGAGVASRIRFYDLTDPANPALVASYAPSRTPHEIFLWRDPANPKRALLFMSTPTSSADAARPNLIVTDISNARGGSFKEIALWNGNPSFSAETRNTDDVRLHSIGVSVDGKRTYLAYLGGGFLILDSSQVAAGVTNPKLTLATPVDKRVHWGNPGAHSAVKVPGKQVALLTDEVYGDALDPITRDNHGCPWGWMRLIGIGKEGAPQLLSEFKMPQNDAARCEGVDGIDPADTLATSYASHNPTVLRSLALVTWHSAGLVAVSVANPAKPRLLAQYLPQPLGSVSTEDPALSLGRNKVVMWSYPIIVNGLIYVTDVRNGLYVLRYRGPHQNEIDGITFLEGNSNLGDAARLEGAVLGEKQSAPAASKPAAGRRPRAVLPATGVADAAQAAGMLLAAAVAGAALMARRRRRRVHQ